MPGGAYEGRSNNKSFDLEGLKKLNKKYGLLCPLNTQDMRLTGQYGDEYFDYAKIEI